LTKTAGPVITSPMNPYSNLPPEQRPTQRLVDQFNADERLWKKLEPKRAARRKIRPRLSAAKLKHLALQELAQASPPQDCIGELLDRSAHGRRRMVDGY